MKVFKNILFCFGCLAIFLIAGAVSCAIRAKYRSLPQLRSTLAYSNAGLVYNFSFLQYNQASGEEGRTALMRYLEVLQKIQN